MDGAPKTQLEPVSMTDMLISQTHGTLTILSQPAREWRWCLEEGSPSRLIRSGVVEASRSAGGVSGSGGQNCKVQIEVEVGLSVVTVSLAGGQT